MPFEQISFAPSKNIKDILYDADQQSLYVLFHSNRVYRYDAVTEELAGGFGESLSANDHLQTVIAESPLSNPVTGEDIPAPWRPKDS